MKNLFLTGAFALLSFAASAQFMIVADIDTEEFDTENITETTDFGFGYSFNETWTVGAMMMGEGVSEEHEGETEEEHAEHAEEEDFRLFVRYNWNESIYLTANTTTEDFSDNLRIGAGYSFNVYDNFFIEPNYTMNVSTDDNDDDRHGAFKLGLAYRF